MLWYLIVNSINIPNKAYSTPQYENNAPISVNFLWIDHNHKQQQRRVEAMGRNCG